MRHFGGEKFRVIPEFPIRTIDEGIQVLAERDRQRIIQGQRDEVIILMPQRAGATKPFETYNFELDKRGVPSYLVPINVDKRKNVLIEPAPDELESKLDHIVRKHRRSHIHIKFGEDHMTTGLAIKKSKDTINTWHTGGLLGGYLDDATWDCTAVSDYSGFSDYCILGNGLNKAILDDIKDIGKIGTESVRNETPRSQFPDFNKSLDLLCEDIIVDERIEKKDPIVLMGIEPEEELIKYMQNHLALANRDVLTFLIDEPHKQVDLRNKLPKKKSNLIQFLYSVGQSSAFSFNFGRLKLDRLEKYYNYSIYAACVYDWNNTMPSSDFARLRASKISK